MSQDHARYDKTTDSCNLLTMVSGVLLPK